MNYEAKILNENAKFIANKIVTKKKFKPIIFQILKNKYFSICSKRVNKFLSDI